MRVVKAEEELLEFDNGDTITSDWSPSCCEYNYADFSAIMDEELRNCEFDSVSFGRRQDGIGFNLIFHGLPHKRMEKYDKTYFVPCYSDQNGWYSSELTIYHNGKEVYSLNGDVR